MIRRVGDRVFMTDDAVENYGPEYAGRRYTITHVATRYMPAAQFYEQGQPQGYHPGYDGNGGALYDLDGLNFSLYEWEVC